MRRWTAVAGVLLITACGGEAMPILSAEGVSREVPAGAPVADAVTGMTGFGHDLYKAAMDPSENGVISPLSIATAFAMARAGAEGDATDQLDRVFGFPAGDVTGGGPHAAYNDLTRKIVNAGDPLVAIANAQFVQNGYEVRQPFLRTLAAHYGAGVRTVDFSSGEAAGEINRWVREETRDRIDRLFDDIPPNTRLVLANAVYMKARWETPFGKHPTEDGDFTIAGGGKAGGGKAGGGKVRVPMMRQKEPMGYAKGRGWQAVELPYTGGELAMRVIVPSGDARPHELLSPAVLGKVDAGLKETAVDLSLPRWDFAADLDLLPPLKELGFTDVEGFGGIAPGVYLDQAVHRANISVDEQGTEAAAVSGLGFAESAGPEAEAEVKADRPFAFVIVHRPTGAPLFLGHVADPAQ